METQKLNTTAMLTIALTAAIMTTLVSGLLTTSRRVQNFGSVRGIGLGVYSDQACKTNLTSISWGELTPSQNSSRTIYLKNLGNVKVKLTMTTGNWTPQTASSYLTLTWNRENANLDAGATINATLTLKVLPNAQGGSFSFDIAIVATETQ